jgi:DNA-directed RNA polymerase subunit E'/Rpb7
MDFVDEEIHDVVKVPPACIGRNISTKVLEILRAKFEDKCSRFGYIRHGSIQIVKIGAAQVELHSLCGYVNVYVIFRAQTLNPPEKSLVPTQIRNINRFGILAVVQLDGKDVMQIIIPKQIALMRSSVNLDRIHIGDRVMVEIVKRRIEVGENVLYGIGRIADEESHLEELEEDDDVEAVKLLKPDDDELIDVEDDEEEEEPDGEVVPEEDAVPPEEEEELGVDDDDGLSEVFSIDEEEEADVE